MPDIHDVLRPEGKFGPAPQHAIFADQGWLVIQNADITIFDTLAYDHPHSLNCGTLIFSLEAEDHFSKVARLQCPPNLYVSQAETRRVPASVPLAIF